MYQKLGKEVIGKMKLLQFGPRHQRRIAKTVGITKSLSVGLEKAETVANEK